MFRVLSETNIKVKLNYEIELDLKSPLGFNRKLLRIINIVLYYIIYYLKLAF